MENMIVTPKWDGLTNGVVDSSKGCRVWLLVLLLPEIKPLGHQEQFNGHYITETVLLQGLIVQQWVPCWRDPRDVVLSGSVYACRMSSPFRLCAAVYWTA